MRYYFVSIDWKKVLIIMLDGSITRVKRIMLKKFYCTYSFNKIKQI